MGNDEVLDCIFVVQLTIASLLRAVDEYSAGGNIYQIHES